VEDDRDWRWNDGRPFLSTHITIGAGASSSSISIVTIVTISTIVSIVSTIIVTTTSVDGFWLLAFRLPADQRLAPLPLIVLWRPLHALLSMIVVQIHCERRTIITITFTLTLALTV
jgi:hypothetical protein